MNEVLKWHLEEEEEYKYFIRLSNGDCIGYDSAIEQYSLNNYWNVIDETEVVELIKKHGLLN